MKTSCRRVYPRPSGPTKRLRPAMGQCADGLFGFDRFARDPQACADRGRDVRLSAFCGEQEKDETSRVRQPEVDHPCTRSSCRALAISFEPYATLPNTSSRHFRIRRNGLRRKNSDNKTGLRHVLSGGGVACSVRLSYGPSCEPANFADARQADRRIAGRRSMDLRTEMGRISCADVSRRGRDPDPEPRRKIAQPLFSGTTRTAPLSVARSLRSWTARSSSQRMERLTSTPCSCAFIPLRRG